MKKQGFLKGSAILLGMVIITKILGLIYKIPLTRLLGGTGMGYFSSAFAVFTPVLAVAVSGIPSTIVRITAENYAFERYRNIRKIKRTAMLIFGAIGMLSSALVALLSPVLANGLIHERNAVWSLIAISPSVFAAAVLSVERGYYEGLKNMMPTAISEIVETVFKLTLGLGAAYAVMAHAMNEFDATHGCFNTFCRTKEDALNVSLPFVAAASILGTSLATGVAALYIIISGKIHGDGITKQMLDRDRTQQRFSEITAELFRYAVPIAAASVITTFSGMIDLITINPCLSKAIEKAEDLFKGVDESLSSDMLPNFIYGSYTGLALTIFGLVPTLTAMFGKSVLPVLAESWTKGDQKQVGKSIGGMIAMSALIAVPSGLGISVLSREILEFLYSGRTAEIAVSVRPLAVLGIGVIFMGISLPCFSVLQTIGRQHIPIIIILVGGAAKLLLNILLIPIAEINITGAAISTVVSQGLICIWSCAEVIKAAEIRLDISKIFGTTLFSAVLCAAAARLSYDIISEKLFISINQRIVLLLSIAFGSIIYFISMYLLCDLPKKQIKALFSKKVLKNP